MKTIKNNGAGFVWPQREYFVTALIATPVIVVLFAIGAFDDLPLNLVDISLAFILSDAAMFYLGIICFRLSEEDVVQYNLELRRGAFYGVMSIKSEPGILVPERLL